MKDELDRSTELPEKRGHRVVFAKVLDCANSIDFYNKEIERLSAQYEVWKAWRKEQEDKAYEYMKRFTVRDVSMFEDFLGKVRERVREALVR